MRNRTIDDAVDGALFGTPPESDRELITLEEAAALAGEAPAVFWSEANKPCGLYPHWHGWPNQSKQYTKDARGKWILCARWRRGAVIAAITQRDAARVTNPLHQHRHLRKAVEGQTP